MNQDQTADQTARRPEPTGTGFDAPYTFGRHASTYLAPREIVRLTILRSKMREPRLAIEAATVDPVEPATE
jgi:hypothetical protein